MQQTLRKSLALAALGLAGIAATGAAQAGGVNWSIGINLPLAIVGGNGGYYAEPAYYAPPPVYYPPPPVYYAPPPVVYGPPVVYRQPRVVYGPPAYYQGAPRYYGPPRGGQWQHSGHGHHGGGYASNGDSDRWRDRDHDGIPNRWDRRD